MRGGKFDLAIAIALTPIIGTGLVLTDQIGRLLFYGVPPEFLELDAYKILLSSVSMLLMGSTIFYLGSTFYEQEDSSPLSRFFFHLLFATVVTAPFWLGDFEFGRPVSLPSVGFIFLTGVVLFGIERWLKRDKKEGVKEQISDWSLISFFGSLMVLAATITHGYLSERDRTSLTFLAGSNNAVVSRAGDLLIVKTYDPTTKAFDKDRTKLVSSEGAVLETRKID